ncbi:UDP-glucuronate:xylan alpha-glucuronosyltransferase 1 [Raphanus sativus]|uniref:Hexosyltransferase n=1 Tax=Raphanus sativus TaxID=3726 RepID=A0A6J0JDU8_RAPSA|nr:UDP-glucuronate:xylan alpha-glucuronosyltransferase 1 isoform X2 [Raphanus sativus]XP_056855260.1 UDP-glucuronate:xylan alpha-glucuronosyltransferase 1 isoform X2 [Raphanus sativus]KAJ4869034.1 UDP-glucuronate:xylan alpha-glucuronosyltransferase 1 [Raphanus sativus]KAJ4886876.1 UDP-glucuronate:xylan alpha-glucuronosyltransferase 1 [Raphanus sativus]
MANSPAAPAAIAATGGDSRRRLSASIEAICKRRFRRNSKDGGRPDMVKPFNIINFPTGNKISSCCCSKFQIVKVLLFVLLLATLFTIIYSPEVYHHSLSHSSSRWIWRRQDSRYVSDLEINWDDVTKTLESVQEGRTIGVLNFDLNEIQRWRELAKTKENEDEENVIVLDLDYADKNVTWDALYPEWIDEEQDTEVPVCPDLPKIKVPTRRLDLIVVKLPCRKEGNWSRDVGRLHLQMAAATVAASAKGFFRGHVLFVSRCFPIPNLFRCKDLVSRRGDVWLYKPNLDTLRDKLQLPIGSCELSLPLGITERPSLGNPKREAYATILHSAHVYVCGAIAAAQSIRQSGSTRDLVILVDDNISGYHRSGLEAAGWQIRTIQRIRNPKAEKDAYNEWNYSKFRLWQLTDYDKIIFIDADLLILRNIDFLFSMPEISATGNNGTLFNSGVMVIEPCNCTFELLMEHINEIESYNGGDQGYLNEVFTWWHRIPKHMNFLKHFWVGDEDDVRSKKTELFGAEPPVLYVLHYLGMKPWLCYRDYDCNFNSDIFVEFATDIAHRRWWMVHDAMPKELHQFCYLRSKQKAQLEYDRRQAEVANYTDGHWKIRVKDPRFKICIDKLCNWKSMLKHWGESNSNWTDDEYFVPTPPAITAVRRSSLPGNNL